MKTHARNTAVGGIMLPIALLLATLIANEGQTLIGLELDRVSLAIFLLPFLYGCAEVIKHLLKFEAARIGEDLFNGLPDLFPPPGPAAGPPGPETPPPPPPPPAGPTLPPSL